MHFSLTPCLAVVGEHNVWNRRLLCFSPRDAMLARYFCAPVSVCLSYTGLLSKKEMQGRNEMKGERKEKTETGGEANNVNEIWKGRDGWKENSLVEREKKGMEVEAERGGGRVGKGAERDFTLSLSVQSGNCNVSPLQSKRSLEFSWIPARWAAYIAAMKCTVIKVRMKTFARMLLARVLLLL